MRITKKKLRQIIQEEWDRINEADLDRGGMEEFESRFDAAYRMPSGRYRGQPDEALPGTPDPRSIPVEVDKLGMQLQAALQQGDRAKAEQIKRELKQFGEIGTDEIYYRSRSVNESIHSRR